MIRTRELRYGQVSTVVRKVASAALVFSAFQFGSIALAQAAAPNDFVALLFTGKFKTFSERLSLSYHGPVKKDQSVGGGLTQEAIQERNNTVRALYNKLLQNDANFRLFVQGIESKPELSRPFELNGKFDDSLELGVSVMQAFFSASKFPGKEKLGATTFISAEFDVLTAKALCHYVTSAKGRTCVEN